MESHWSEHMVHCVVTGEISEAIHFGFTQILRGDGSGPFQGRTFIGCDNHPVTFQVGLLGHRGLLRK